MHLGTGHVSRTPLPAVTPHRGPGPPLGTSTPQQVRPGPCPGLFAQGGAVLRWHQPLPRPQRVCPRDTGCGHHLFPSSVCFFIIFPRFGAPEEFCSFLRRVFFGVRSARVPLRGALGPIPCFEAVLVNQKDQDVSARSHRGSQDPAVPILALLPGGGLQKSLSGEFRVQEGGSQPPEVGSRSRNPPTPPPSPVYCDVCLQKINTLKGSDPEQPQNEFFGVLGTNSCLF